MEQLTNQTFRKITGEVACKLEPIRGFNAISIRLLSARRANKAFKILKIEGRRVLKSFEDSKSLIIYNS